jgi:hypothetical protein
MTMRNKKLRKSIYLMKLDVRKPLVVSTSQRNEELRLYNLVKNLTISKPRLESGIFKCISWSYCSFFGGDDRGFLIEEVKA